MLLRELSELPGVSGREDEVRSRLWQCVRDFVDGGRSDVLGNLIVWKGADRAGPRVMVAAHMDEVGLMVSCIDKDGLLRFQKVGGIDDRVLVAKVVTIGPGRVAGVIGVKPVHLLGPEERKKVVRSEDLAIDIGAGSREEAERAVQVGEYATFATTFVEFGAGLYRGKAFDDRAGCAILAELLRSDYPFPLFGVFTVQEEIGLRGARVAAYDLAPDLALVLEGTTCADVPETDGHGESTRLGAGPALTFMDATSRPNKAMVQALIRTAEREGIPWQWKRTTAGGTDAGAIHVSRAGVPTATVSVPCRYIHSPAAVMSRFDFDNTFRLVQAFLRDLAGGEPGIAAGGLPFYPGGGEAHDGSR